MDIQPITMDKKLAREHFERYRALVRKRSQKEDVALMRGFKALSQGRQIIDIVTVMKAAGVDELFRPNLAIIRADAKECFFINYIRPDEGARFTPVRSPAPNATRRCFTLPSDALPKGAETVRAKAMVPIVPAQYRPHDAISNYHILWEAEWQAEPPRDPVLLKRIAKYTFVVLAQWDLTELERSVLRGV